jgi:hypothetical protein
LDERRANFPPHLYVAPTRESQVKDKPSAETQILQRWFVGDHSDVGGRFLLQARNVPALANPSFRWIVWGAAHAAANNRRSLLFDHSAFTKYSGILIYTKDDSTQPGSSHFRRHSPEHDSTVSIADPVSGRPMIELNDIKQDINNAFKHPSVWRLVQIFHGKGLHGNARKIDGNCVLHASVTGKISTDQKYGGKRRKELHEAAADEAIAKAFIATSPATTTESSPSAGPLSLHVHIAPVGFLFFFPSRPLYLSCLYVFRQLLREMYLVRMCHY